MKIITYLFILLVIFTIPLFSFVGYIAHAIPLRDSESIYESSAIIVVGKILSVNSTFSPTLNLYQIQIEKFLKNSYDEDIVLAVGQNTEILRIGNHVFDKDDKGLFFLQNNTSIYEERSEIFQLHYVSQQMTSEWESCDIFANDFPKEHWVFGGNPRLKIQQENKTENFVTGKTILITYDIFNHTPIEKKLDFGMTIKDIDDPDSLYLFHENAFNILEPCTPYRTLTWTFTPNEQGRYSFELDNLMGSTQSRSIHVDDPLEPSPEKVKALCEDSEFELVDGICQKIIQTKDIHSSYANGYDQMIIPILLLVIVSIISVIYYKKLKNEMHNEN